MTDRLGRKLGLNPLPATAATHAVRKPCFMVDEKCGFTCEFRQANGGAWVLPYARLSSAELTPDCSTLTVSFASHSVRIDGTRLELIKDALARGRNLLVRAVEPRWKADYPNDEVFVSAIEVTEQDEREAMAEAAPKTSR